MAEEVFKAFGCPREECSEDLFALDIPAARMGNESVLYECREGCGNIWRKDDSLVTGFENVTKFFEQLGMGDDRIRSALSSEHEVGAFSVMDIIGQWRAASEMETLAMIGLIQQRFVLLDNRLHSLKKRLAESLLGAPTPMDTNEMLRLVDECIDFASTTPPSRRGVSRRRI